MPAYDCGSPECEECRRVFGPERKTGSPSHMLHEAFMALPSEVRDRITARRAQSETQEAA